MVKIKDTQFCVKNLKMKRKKDKKFSWKMRAVMRSNLGKNISVRGLPNIWFGGTIWPNFKSFVEFESHNLFTHRTKISVEFCG